MSTQDQIRQRIESFSRELEGLVRSAAIDAVRTALGADAPRPPRPSTSAVKSMPPARAGSLVVKRQKGAKRSPEQLAKIDAAILGYVKAHAGKRIEEMATSLGVPTSDLKLRVALLVQSRKLKKTGVKRATKYFTT